MPNVDFSTPNQWHVWNVPEDVELVEVILEGGGSTPVNGGRVTGKLRVNQNQRLYVWVGDNGNLSSGATGGAAGSTNGGGGRGGNGTTGNGGRGGGGATILRLNATDGTLKAVAGGAGGRSGDGGNGGEGGAATGESGFRGTYDVGETGNATGGTPTQGGNGGSSSGGSQYDGANAANTVLARGGAGANGVHGGGGGGGGYRSGGGGNGAAPALAPAGGGGGGSNYVGGLTGAQTQRGTGDTGVGFVQIGWVAPPPKNQPPTTPTTVKINGKAEANALPTKSTGSVTFTAVLDDPDGDRVRMVLQYSAHSNMSGAVVRQSKYVRPKNDANNVKGVAELTISGLTQDTRYYYRIYSEDERGKRSVNYNSGNFWTNRAPTAPTLTAPAENSSWSTLASITFTWNVNDPDPSDTQSAFQLEYRPAGTPSQTRQIETVTSTRQWVANPDTFLANRFYEWRVRTRDEQKRWGVWSGWRSFFVSGVSTPPKLLDPVKCSAIDAGAEYAFCWRFQDPSPGDYQTNADIRYRAVNPDNPDGDWTVILGDPGEGGFLENCWTIPANTFPAGYQWEWEVRTYDQLNNQSQWSDPECFRTVVSPGGAVDPPILSSDTAILGSLGCGVYRVFVMAQGGQHLLGEITDVTALTFMRVRDDISRCDIVVTGFEDDCGALLASLRSWMHEIVLFRDGQRVWEGPVSRITYTVDGVSIEAKDVMNYLYRRIMKQGYNDAYRVVDNIQVGQVSVVKRAKQIAMNAFAEYDPNVLPYMTTYEFPDDAKQGRIVLDFAKSAWEEIDDLAATAGLDYTVIGRRILFWDTHRPIGRLPELRDGDFSDPPVVTEYGMQLCNYYAVTNNSGSYGVVRPEGEEVNGQFYGPIEILASAYGETSSSVDMTTQAHRNISNRWPTPLIVRVPDNSTLNPEVNVTFDQLVPGVLIPLRATGTLREVSQWQKLDSVTVEFIEGVERVKVVMSPAPNGGIDPDADAAAVIEAEG